jgi:hypothetical protein
MIRPHPPTHPEDLMKPDLFSEILLVGSGLVLFVPLLLILVTAFSQSGPVR